MRNILLYSFNLIKERVKLGRAGRKGTRLKGIKARQRWKWTSHCRQGQGRMCWHRSTYRHNLELTGDMFAEPVTNFSLGLAKSSLAFTLSTLVLNWKGLFLSLCSLWSLQHLVVLAASSAGWLEHDLASSVDAESARPQMVLDGRPDHLRSGSPPAQQGMWLSVWQEIWAMDMGSEPLRWRLILIALPQPPWARTAYWVGRWGGEQTQSLVGHFVLGSHMCIQQDNVSGCVWGYLGQQAVWLPGKFTARGHPARGGPSKGGMNVSLNVSSS